MAGGNKGRMPMRVKPTKENGEGKTKKHKTSGLWLTVTTPWKK